MRTPSIPSGTASSRSPAFLEISVVLAPAGYILSFGRLIRIFVSLWKKPFVACSSWHNLL